jgi:hypothetical protein
MTERKKYAATRPRKINADAARLYLCNQYGGLPGLPRGKVVYFTR